MSAAARSASSSYPTTLSQTQIVNLPSLDDFPVPVFGTTEVTQTDQFSFVPIVDSLKARISDRGPRHKDTARDIELRKHEETAEKARKFGFSKTHAWVRSRLSRGGMNRVSEDLLHSSTIRPGRHGLPRDR